MRVCQGSQGVDGWDRPLWSSQSANNKSFLKYVFKGLDASASQHDFFAVVGQGSDLVGHQGFEGESVNEGKRSR